MIFVIRSNKEKEKLKLQKWIKSINEPELTGGYIIEADHWAKREEVYAESKRGVVYRIKYPDEDDIVPEQNNYINNTFNLAEEEVYNN